MRGLGASLAVTLDESFPTLRVWKLPDEAKLGLFRRRDARSDHRLSRFGDKHTRGRPAHPLFQRESHGIRIAFARLEGRRRARL